MKYYSEKLTRLFDSPEACQMAEKEAIEAENREKIRKEREEREAKAKKEKAIADRKALAAEVEDARKAMTKAQSIYKEKLEKFVKTYGSYHLSLKDEDAKNIIPSLFDIFNPLFFNL